MMLSHVTIGVGDVERSCRFYGPILAALGLRPRFADAHWAGWQPSTGDRPLFIVTRPFDGEVPSAGNGQMIALMANARDIVDQCHAMALELGGTAMPGNLAFAPLTIPTTTAPISAIPMGTSYVSAATCLSERISQGLVKMGSAGIAIAPAPPEHEAYQRGRHVMADRQGITRAFLWLAVLAGGPLLGAKLFDLVVLAGTWSAHPPASLAMIPYGKAWPVDTGVFFIPLSAAMLLAGFGALVAGWRTPWRYRWLLCLPSIGILLLLILTLIAFWPMNAALFYHGVGSP